MNSRFAIRIVLARAALSAFGMASVAHAAVYTVGNDAACSFASFDPAAAAADAHPGADEIHVAGTSNNLSSPDFTNQAILISVSAGEQLDIIGGFADCSQAASTGTRTIIDGAGGVTQPVFRITVATGGLVRMSYITIQNGDEDGSGKGGGIYFKGDGILELNHAVLTRNTAGYGGGIYAEGTGSNTELVIGTDVSINQNNARFDGGGIVNDGTEMTMTAPDSSLAFNHAPNGYGGGLLVRGDDRGAYTYLGTSGFGTSGAIFFNDAKYGGGVALHGGSSVDEVLHLFTTDPTRPMRISNNTASVEGGGIYGGVLWAWQAWIENNSAPHGAAIYLNTGYFNDSGHRPLGAIGCPVGAPCGGIVGNTAIDAASQPSGGVLEDGWMVVNRVTMAGNTGKSLIAGNAGLVTQHVAMVGNTVSGSLMSVENSAVAFKFDNTTIAGNSVGDGTVLRIWNGNDSGGNSYGWLRRTIIWQPGKTTLHLNGPPLALLDDIVSERGSVDGGNTPYVSEADPRFVDPEHGDYGLRAASPAVDRTTSVAGDTTDLYGNPRDVKLPIVTNGWQRDIGAIERQTLQPLVLNADFDTDLRLWTAVNTSVATSTRDASMNKTGAAGSGSAYVLVPNQSTGSSTGGLVQCVQLPGPGFYSLNGWGHGTGTQFAIGDNAQLYWEYRKNGGAGCTGGTPNAVGTVVLSTGNFWSQSSMPGQIQVTEQDMSQYSSIAVYLVAKEFGTGGSPTKAWFDGITLSVAGDDTIFANGFDIP